MALEALGAECVRRERAGVDTISGAFERLEAVMTGAAHGGVF